MSKPQDHRGVVTVIGAGITGLSVAHELVERGFHVIVVERERTNYGPSDVVLGGIAANHERYAFKEDFEEASPPFQQAIVPPVLDPPIRFHHGRAVLKDEPLNADYIRGLASTLAQTLVNPNAQPLRVLKKRVKELETKAEKLGEGLNKLRDSARVHEGTRTAHHGQSLQATPTQKRVDNEDSEDREDPQPDRDNYYPQPLTLLDTKTLQFMQSLGGGSSTGEGLTDGGGKGGESRAGNRVIRGRQPLVIQVNGRADADRDFRRGLDNYELSLERAKAVRDALSRELGAQLKLVLEKQTSNTAEEGPDSADERFWRLASRQVRVEDVVELNVTGSGINRGHADHDGEQKSEHACHRTVDVRLGMTELPSEHGYRFFPSGYRHVNDILGRIPIYDAEDVPTPETVLDNLVSSNVAAVYPTRGQKELRFERGVPESLEGIRVALLQILRDVRLTERDLLRYQLKLFEYMTSCSARREDHYENESWLEFLGAVGKDDQSTGKYSVEFVTQIKAANVAFVGARAAEAEARTSGNVTVQQLLDQFRFAGDIDRTLNAPTSKAWFAHWRRYLAGQGVRFFIGAVDHLSLKAPADLSRPHRFGPHECLIMPDTGCRGVPVPDNLWPVFESDLFDTLHLRHKSFGEVVNEVIKAAYGGDKSGSHTEAPHYTILALDAVSARRVVSGKREDKSLLAHEDVFREPCEPCDLPLEARIVGKRDLCKLRAWAALKLPNSVPVEAQCKLVDPPKSTDPLQPFSGVQLYFRERLSFFRGYMHFPDSAWKLTAQFQLQFWRDGVRAKQGFLSVLSVDVGEWDKEIVFDFKNRDGEFGAPVKNTAWLCTPSQLAQGVWAQIRESVPNGRLLPDPAVFHVDQNVLFRTPRELPGELHNRHPCFDRTAAEPTYQTHKSPYLIAVRGQWKERPGEPGNYTVAKAAKGSARAGGVVLAGTFMKTHTRLTTMESANESARHAVNAVLDDFRRYSTGGLQVGAPCELFPWEENELEDLDPLKRLDEDLHQEKLPHLCEILGLDELPDLLFPDGGPQGDPAWLAKHFLTRLLAEDRDLPLPKEANLGSLQQVLQDILRGILPGSGG
ncbi:FAD-dependent oxidoreductase [Planctomycetota bacterium]|nr:FAD-dependent oxidoreductase [Planctomycetota bacterium]